MLEVGGLPNSKPFKVHPIQIPNAELTAMNVRVIKREERQAANNLVVADQTASAPRMTPEMVVKSWISAARERRQVELKVSLVNFKRQSKLCLAVAD